MTKPTNKMLDVLRLMAEGRELWGVSYPKFTIWWLQMPGGNKHVDGRTAASLEKRGLILPGTRWIGGTRYHLTPPGRLETT